MKKNSYEIRLGSWSLHILENYQDVKGRIWWALYGPANRGEYSLEGVAENLESALEQVRAEIANVLNALASVKL
jgi:hypothetical protein